MKRERRFMRLQDIGCICCLLDGNPGVPADMNHLVDMGNRELSGGDAATIPLCPWHHRGLPPTGMAERIARLKHGPSLRLHKKDFNDKYGGERRLLIEVNRRIEELENAA